MGVCPGQETHGNSAYSTAYVSAEGGKEVVFLCHAKHLSSCLEQSIDLYMVGSICLCAHPGYVTRHQERDEGRYFLFPFKLAMTLFLFYFISGFLIGHPAKICLKWRVDVEKGTNSYFFCLSCQGSDERRVAANGVRNGKETPFALVELLYLLHLLCSLVHVKRKMRCAPSPFFPFFLIGRSLPFPPTCTALHSANTPNTTQITTQNTLTANIAHTSRNGGKKTRFSLQLFFTWDSPSLPLFPSSHCTVQHPLCTLTSTVYFCQRSLSTVHVGV